MSSDSKPPPAVERGRRWNAALDGPPERRFHAFGVGLAKTGTSSLAESFARYRAGHEFMFQEAVEQVARWRAGELSEPRMRAFLHERDAAGGLEMDSTSFNHFYVELLVEEFPDAKFVFTLRGCIPWVESFLQMMLRNRRRHLQWQESLPQWQKTLGQLMVGDFDPELFVSHATLVRALPGIVDGYLRFWTRANSRVLACLPRERSIIVRTPALSESLPEIARFLGADPGRLVTESAHANRGDAAAPLLATLGRDLLLERARAQCGALMDQLFPDWQRSV